MATSSKLAVSVLQPVITPVGKYVTDEGKEYTVGTGEIGEHTRAIYEKYTSMQRGETEAPEGWLRRVPRS